ncbi:DUF4955 domain-containing protein [Pelagicoccus mobilis]|uniref:DUF4955 domain-containing protein n=1 Tax=Pelagicoccus mobilis TaxID=415221 RepID=A0A934RV13_9BACT|nr:DUF4955 domain-containing protein [Pelagicoccus mobilis]MBK1875341.1 DUF4955 domain-containing protein [Pelagicoccus mobilis]
MRASFSTYRLIALVFSLAVLLGGCEEQEIGRAAMPKSWANFLETRGVGEEAVLPDFSFAGYHYSERPIPEVDGPAFLVRDFGAIPDDGKLDLMAVQGAIDAASKAGGGVVLFEGGRYLMNSEGGIEKRLRLAASNVVLKGMGSGLEGTELYWPRHLEPEVPGKMYSTPFMIEVSPKSTQEKTLTKLIGRAKKGQFEIRVADASKLSVGDWITLRLSDPKAIKLFFGGRTPRKEWERSWTQGVQVAERHQVVAIDGQAVRFKEPLQVDVEDAHDWTLCSYPALEEVGLEGMRLTGDWKGDFVHHRSALDDGGWSALYLKNVRNGWIRDVEFKNWNYALKMSACSAFSVFRTRLTGTPGHHGVQARGGYGVLVGLSSDQAGHFHGPSVGYQSASTVYWRYDYGSKSSFDAHSTFPYATLLDACSGGWRYGRSGGPMAGMPNHMRGLVVWNFKRTGGKEPKFDFWRSGEFDDRDLFLEPVFVGFHGVETEFNLENMGLVESLGKRVDPLSLFEAQLMERTGGVPGFLVEELERWNAESKK